MKIETVKVVIDRFDLIRSEAGTWEVLVSGRTLTATGETVQTFTEVHVGKHLTAEEKTNLAAIIATIRPRSRPNTK